MIVLHAIVLLLTTLLGTVQSPASEDAKAALDRAEALYYEAKFKESLEVLLPLDAGLRPEDEELQEKLRAKLQMALDHIGLNEIAEARLLFAELSALNSRYSLDPQQFSPKVIALFEEARTRPDQTQCRSTCDDLRRQLAAGNYDALNLSGQSTESGCGCISDLAADIVQVLYKQGVEAYNRDQFTEALQKFHTALKLQPKDELAAQYIELTENKARLTVDQLSLDWRKNFDAGQYAVASDKYRKLAALSFEGKDPALDEMRGEYRKALPPLVGSWNQACQAGDASAMTRVRAKATELLPDPTIGADILGQMTECISKVDTPKEVARTSPASCIAMESRLAMTRVRTKVDPAIAPGFLQAVLRSTSSVQVQVQFRIDEKGNVAVNRIEGDYASINNAVKDAVQAWRFIPAIIENEPRCVDTSVRIAIKR